MGGMERLTCYSLAKPGDVLVLAAGDVRQVSRVEAAGPSYVHCDWSDGTQTVHSRGTPTTRLFPHSPSATKARPTSTQEQTPDAAD